MQVHLALKEKKKDALCACLRVEQSTYHVSDLNTVDVTLDYDTAHPKLIVSDDMKSVSLVSKPEQILLSWDFSVWASWVESSAVKSAQGFQSFKRKIH